MTVAPWLTSDEFDKQLGLLPAGLRERVVALQPYVLGPRRDREVVQFVDYAFLAAFHADEPTAAQMVERAELHAARSAPPERIGEPPVRSAKPSTIMMRGLRGQVPGHRGSVPLLAATDASAKKVRRRRMDDVIGWAYITTDGRWGCAGAVFEGRLNPHRRGASLSGELRAVYMMLTDLGALPSMTVLMDSMGAIRFLRLWQAGRVEVMPDGYSQRPRLRSGDGKPTLRRLAELVAAHPQLTFEHVTGHAGHPLNEAADGLAKLARRCAGGEQPGSRTTLTERASNLATAFLQTWRAQTTPGAPDPTTRGR